MSRPNREPGETPVAPCLPRHLSLQASGAYAVIPYLTFALGEAGRRSTLSRTARPQR